MRQDCILPILILIDWVMKNIVKDRQQRIQWGIIGQMKDLDFPLDLVIMSQLQDKIIRPIHLAKQAS